MGKHLDDTALSWEERGHASVVYATDVSETRKLLKVLVRIRLNSSYG